MFLELAEWSQGISRAKFASLKAILRRHGIQLPCVRRLESRLQRLTGIKPQFIHCCVNSCIAYTGGYADASKCPHCKEDRYIAGISRARKQFAFIPLVDRLKLQYRNVSRARILSSYRDGFTQDDSRTKCRDVFDGKLYHEFHRAELGLFQESRDIALHMSLDGVQVTNMRHHEVTPVIFINLNLPPGERYKVENILASMIIPGPNKPKELDTFLRPLVEELKQLDCGVEAFDANTSCTFTLKAWVTMVTGNSFVIADAIGL